MQEKLNKENQNDQSEPNEQSDNENKKRNNEIVSFIKTAAIFLVLWLFIRGTIIEAFKIPSGSMIPTLQIGDYLLVNKLAYGIRLPFVDNAVYEYSKPKRGDIVVFTKEDIDSEEEENMNFIKRVIAVEGDKVSLKNMIVYINGEPTHEDYAQWVYGGLPSGEFDEITVPKGHIFLLGDNRDRSKDSRYWNSHFLPTKRVKGKALFIYWSFNDLKRIFNVIK
ncbi:MAG: signal peptidase I [Bdellovibrionota bacterium]